MENIKYADVKTSDIWAYLHEMFDMDGLNDTESRLLNECDFFLPEGEFGQLMHAKEEEAEQLRYGNHHFIQRLIAGYR